VPSIDAIKKALAGKGLTPEQIEAAAKAIHDKIKKKS
jgi:hypothetical protein